MPLSNALAAGLVVAAVVICGAVALDIDDGNLGWLVPALLWPLAVLVPAAARSRLVTGFIGTLGLAAALIAISLLLPALGVGEVSIDESDDDHGTVDGTLLVCLIAGVLALPATLLSGAILGWLRVLRSL